MFISEILGPDLLVVVIIGALVLFGGSAIPKLARNLGQSKTEFEKGMKSAKADPAHEAETNSAARPTEPSERS